MHTEAGIKTRVDQIFNLLVNRGETSAASISWIRLSKLGKGVGLGGVVEPISLVSSGRHKGAMSEEGRG